MKYILFLCTGNYYRSRFAEEYFNYYAEKHELDWKADSMGIMRNFEGNGNIGSMSEHTFHELKRLGIEPQEHRRMPKHVFESHFDEFDRVIAVSIAEHQPMLEKLWDMDNKKIEYFDVEDLHIEGKETALPRLQKHLDKLINELL